MSNKVIKINEDLYNELANLSFSNRVFISDIANECIKVGLKKIENEDFEITDSLNRKVKIVKNRDAL